MRKRTIINPAGGRLGGAALDKLGKGTLVFSKIYGHNARCSQ
jgi:hypothetical protein